MKTLRLILLGAVLADLSFVSLVHAQVYSPRRLTRRIAPQLQPQQQQQAGQAPASTQAPQTAVPAPAPAPMPARQSPVVRVQPPVDPVKAKAAKDEALRKTIENQKKRAEEGSESAQYELGMRYLKGDGVDKDEAAGRKWLELSAKNGDSAARKKLDELSKAPQVPKTDKLEK